MQGSELQFLKNGEYCGPMAKTYAMIVRPVRNRHDTYERLGSITMLGIGGTTDDKSSLFQGVEDHVSKLIQDTGVSPAVNTLV